MSPPFYHSYVRNRFAEENAYGARFSQPWAWSHFNSQHPPDNHTSTVAPGIQCRTPSGLEAVRDRLPDPYWENHDGVIGAYWKVWQLAFDRNVRRATPRNRFVSDFCATAFNDGTFLWDSAFITLFGVYGRHAWNFQGALDNFYCKQHPDGFICREIREKDGEDRFQRFDPAGTGPNVFAWAEWEHFRHTGDRNRLARVFAPIAAYTRWFRLNRTWPDGSYWGTGWSTGMDNQPRIPAGRHEWYEHCHQTWVDTCMQAVLADRMLVAIAREIGREGDAAEFADEADRLTAWINQNLWSEETGFYHDRRSDGSLVTEVKTIGAYWALLAGVVPNDSLPRFLAHLEDPSGFNRAHRCPSLSGNSIGYEPTGGYWRGAVWPPTNYMLLRGLNQIGRPDLAAAIGRNHVENVAAAFEATGTLWENYAPDFPAIGCSTPDFVGWTGLPPVSVLFEEVFGLQPLGPNRLRWNIRLTDAFSVKRYPFAGGILNLSCARRGHPGESPKLTLTGSISVNVEVCWHGGSVLLQTQHAPCSESG